MIPRRPAWKNRRKFKATVHNDDEDDGSGDDDDHWLEPRVTKIVEDEYSHNDPGDEDAAETNYAPSATKSLLKSSDLIPLSNGATDEEPVSNDATDEEPVSTNCTICTHYKNMLYTNFLGPKEMVIVEQPWSEITETFPAALQRRIYGAD